METRQKRKFVFYQQVTLIFLLLGYVGYYFCRSNFAVIKPVLLSEFSILGIDLKALGLISSFGMGAYVAGKLILGPLTDYIGGRLMFVFGMCGSIFATIYFGLGIALPGFIFAWVINRFFQAAGWGAMLQLSTHWVSFRHYGKAMGFLSLSYLFGDAIVRFSLGTLLNYGYGWRGIMLTSAAILSVFAILSWIFILSSPRILGLPEPLFHPGNLFGEKSNTYEFRILPIIKILSAYVGNLSFWLVAFMSLGLTVMRETFNEWSNTFLVEFSEFTPGTAAQFSSIFPFAGGIAGILYGFLSDWTKRFRGLLVGAAQLALALIFFWIWSGDATFHLDHTAIFMAVVAILLVGPYTYMAGVFVMELSGRQGSSSAAAIIDSVGYLGSILAGYGVGSLAQHYTWRSVFLFLSLLAFATSIAGLLFWINREQKISTIIKNLID